MELESAVRAAAGGDLDAFGEIVRRFQHMNPTTAYKPKPPAAVV